MCNNIHFSRNNVTLQHLRCCTSTIIWHLSHNLFGFSVIIKLYWLSAAGWTGFFSYNQGVPLGQPTHVNCGPLNQIQIVDRHVYSTLSIVLQPFLNLTLASTEWLKPRLLLSLPFSLKTFLHALISPVRSCSESTDSLGNFVLPQWDNTHWKPVFRWENLSWWLMMILFLVLKQQQQTFDDMYLRVAGLALFSDANVVECLCCCFYTCRLSHPYFYNELFSFLAAVFLFPQNHLAQHTPITKEFP